MEIEDQGVSLELAREMKELGAPQDSVFAWYQYVIGKPYIALKALQNCQDSIATYHDGYAECPKEICNAPTVAELGEMLKKHMHIFPQWNKYNMGVKWFSDIYTSKGYCQVDEQTEADARAKMWIYLKKNGLL